MSLPGQDSGAGVIDWGDIEAAPVEIDILDIGTDCKCLFFVPQYIVHILLKCPVSSCRS